MTTTMGQDQIVKMDRIGRVKTPRERREALLVEFDRSGMSGQQFAKWAGIKYGTFITWVQKSRRKSGVIPAKDKLAVAGTKDRKRCVERLLTARLGAGHRDRNQKVMASMTSVVDQ